MTAEARRRTAITWIFFGVFTLWAFGWGTVVDRLRMHVEGVIVASRDVPTKGAPRYATEYTVRNAAGEEVVLWAGPTDASLPRSMPVGTHIRKMRGHLGFERDGIHVGFSWVFYGVMIGIGASMVARAVWMLLPLWGHRAR